MTKKSSHQTDFDEGRNTRKDGDEQASTATGEVHLVLDAVSVRAEIRFQTDRVSCGVRAVDGASSRCPDGRVAGHSASNGDRVVAAISESRQQDVLDNVAHHCKACPPTPGPAPRPLVQVSPSAPWTPASSLPSATPDDSKYNIIANMFGKDVLYRPTYAPDTYAVTSPVRRFVVRDRDWCAALPAVSSITCEAPNQDASCFLDLAEVGLHGLRMHARAWINESDADQCAPWVHPSLSMKMCHLVCHSLREHNALLRRHNMFLHDFLCSRTAPCNV